MLVHFLHMVLQMKTIFAAVQSRLHICVHTKNRTVFLKVISLPHLYALVISVQISQLFSAHYLLFVAILS